MGTCRRGDMEQGVSWIIPPCKGSDPQPVPAPETPGMGIFNPAAAGRETEARGDAGPCLKPGLGSRKLEILPGPGAGSTLRLVWGGMWPVGQSLRGGKSGPGPRGVSCSASRFLPGPSAFRRAPETGGVARRDRAQGHRLVPSATGPMLSGMLGCAKCCVASAICRGETEARGSKWGNLAPRTSQGSCPPGRALQVRMPGRLCCCPAAGRFGPQILSSGHLAQAVPSQGTPRWRGPSLNPWADDVPEHPHHWQTGPAEAV